MQALTAYLQSASRALLTCEIVGMIVGAGIGSMIQASSKCGGIPGIPIAFAAIYIFLIAFVMLKLAEHFPNQVSLTKIVAQSMGLNFANAYSLIVAATYIAGGVYVSLTAAGNDISLNLCLIVITCFILWRRKKYIDTFCQFTGVLEVLRFFSITVAIFGLVTGEPLEEISSQEAQSPQTSFLTAAFVTTVTAFAGFETALQHGGHLPRNQLSSVIYGSVATVTTIYILTAQAAVHALGNTKLQTMKSIDVIPEVVHRVMNAFGLPPNVSYYIYFAVYLINFVTVLNGAAGCFKYSSSLIESVAQHQGIRGWRYFTSRRERTPAALLVLAISTLFCLTDAVSLVELFGCLFISMHMICGFSVFRTSPIIGSIAVIVSTLILCMVVYDLFNIGALGLFVIIATLAMVRKQ